MARVLVIEDDAATARAIELGLRDRGFAVEVVADGEAGLGLALAGRYDVITLDRMLPGLDGISLVRRMRERDVHVPVLMISALSDVDERIAGLRAGGDDYLSKPFSVEEMAMRVEALLRRRRAERDERTVIGAGGVEIDLVRREVRSSSVEVKLLPMEFKLLEFMVRNAGQVLSRRFIFEKVWEYYYDPGPNLINVHVARLRKKLDTPGRPTMIETVKGTGYLFRAT